MKKNAFQPARLLSMMPPATLLMLTVAGIINAFGVVLFLSPVQLYDSGASGTSMLLTQLSGLPFSLFLIMVNVPLFLIMVNVPLFLYGLKRQGMAFTIRSIYTVIIYSVASAVFEGFLPAEPSPRS